MRNKTVFSILCLSLFLFSCSGGTSGTSVVTTSGAERRTILGVLRDQHSRPVADAQMTVTAGSGAAISSKTSQSGDFSMQVSDGEVLLSIESQNQSFQHQLSPQLPFPSILSLSLVLTNDSQQAVGEQEESRASLSDECKDSFEFDGQTFVRVKDDFSACSIYLQSRLNGVPAALSDVRVTATCPQQIEGQSLKLSSQGELTFSLQPFLQERCTSLRIAQFETSREAPSIEFSILF